MSERKQQVQQLYASALALQKAGNWKEAEAGYRDLLALAPGLAEAQTGLGNVLQSVRRLREAADCYRAAIAVRPAHVTAHYNLGVVLAALGQPLDAINAYRAAIRIKPELFQAHANLGVLLHDAGDLDQAESSYGAALKLNADDIETVNNLAVLLRDRGRLDDAAALFDRALGLRPQSAEIQRNVGLLHFLKGDYARGWPAYQWRWKCPDFAAAGRTLPWPRWAGETLGDGALFVWKEQALGEEILFSGMIEDLTARGLRVVWEADARLVGLLQRSFPNVDIVPPLTLQALANRHVVAQIPAGDLGSYLRGGLDRFSRTRHAYLKPDPARRDAFRTRLALAPSQRAVGISWRSRNPIFGQHKSSALQDWARLLVTPDVVFVDLQYGDTVAERAGCPGLRHLDDLDLTRDIDGLASLMAACDHIVTVSNTTAHLGGALGCDTSVLVPDGGGKLWYWGHQSESTPWYPTIRLVRQTQRGDWKASLDRVAGRLRAALPT